MSIQKTLSTRITGQPKIIAYSDTVILEADFSASVLPIRWRICRIEDAAKQHPYSTFKPNTDITGYQVPDHHVLITWSPLPFEAILKFDTSVGHELPYPEDSGLTQATITHEVLAPRVTPENIVWSGMAKAGDQHFIYQLDGSIEIWTYISPTEASVEKLPTKSEIQSTKIVEDAADIVIRGNNEYHCEGNLKLTLDITDAELGTVIEVHVPVNLAGKRVKVALVCGSYSNDAGSRTSVFNLTGSAKFKLYDTGLELMSYHRSI